MKNFQCDGCGMMVFFENDRCLKCDHPLGFLPDHLTLTRLEGGPDNLWRPHSQEAGGCRYRYCGNGQQHHICNWLVPENDPNAFCTACRLNEIIPDLNEPGNFGRWAKFELAKRRCIYTLLNLGLPPEGSAVQDLFPLRFRFLQDGAASPVMTGHQNGVITVNIVEADEDERERRRVTLHEPYRTVVGHLRHETGHFFWNRLIANTPNLARFRELFGDETVDYGAALEKYYAQGPANNWPSCTVTAYASSHPWEDWAETWAHYLHIMETLETTASYGVSIQPGQSANNHGQSPGPSVFNWRMDFDQLMSGWFPLTCALNSINRSMGLSDLYPFIISPPVVEKLRFIHQIINSHSSGQTPNPPPDLNRPMPATADAPARS